MTVRKAMTWSGVDEGYSLTSAPSGPGSAANLVRQHDLAMALGVSDKRVATWRTRSAVNGFPAPVACNIGPVKGGGKRRHLLWDLGEVQDWFSRYDERAQRARGGWRSAQREDRQ
jgi:hypothetical protein